MSEENKRTQLGQVSEETMRFMRGKYALDEVAGKYYDIDCLKFRQGKRTILSINILADRYDFQLIFGKAEREQFEAQRDEFPSFIQQIYDSSQTLHDGKWMMFPVADLETLEPIKSLILLKKRPNRKPFPKDQAIYSDCGHRCDLCVHYTGDTISDALRAELQQRVRRVYDSPDAEFPPCDGCKTGGIGQSFDCAQSICAKQKGVPRCVDCAQYACSNATAGLKPAIEPRSISAADVTWAILPYVAHQYGN